MRQRDAFCAAVESPEVSDEEVEGMFLTLPLPSERLQDWAMGLLLAFRPQIADRLVERYGLARA